MPLNSAPKASKHGHFDSNTFTGGQPRATPCPPIRRQTCSFLLIFCSFLLTGESDRVRRWPVPDCAPMALSPKQRKFVDEYLIDPNATQAAIRAGYSQRTARQMGSENLSKPVILEAIAEAMAAAFLGPLPGRLLAGGLPAARGEGVPLAGPSLSCHGTPLARKRGWCYSGASRGYCVRWRRSGTPGGGAARGSVIVAGGAG